MLLALHWTHQQVGFFHLIEADMDNPVDFVILEKTTGNHLIEPLGFLTNLFLQCALERT